MNIFAPITKSELMEDGRLKVYGVATSETLDKDTEIVDYESAKKVFAEWPGNIREQHDAKKAVGRALAITPMDGEKAIGLECFVSAGAKDTQAKVLDGTLAGFSIGASSERKVPEVVKVNGEEKTAVRIFLKRLSEVSLVDSPCNPSCSFQLVKADGDGLTYTDEEAPMPETPEAQPEAPAAEVTKYDGSEITDVAIASQAIASLSQAMDSLGLLLHLEGDEAHNEPPEQMAALVAAIASAKQTISSLGAFIASEALESEADEDVAAADKPADVVKDDVAEPESPVRKDDVAMCQKCGGPMRCDKCDKADHGHEGHQPEPPPSPPEKADEIAPEPADEAGIFVSKLDAFEKRLAEFDTIKAEFDAYRKEGEAREAALKAQVENLSKTVVEPGRPVFKGEDRIPSAAPAAAPNHLLGLTVQDVLKLAPGADPREVGLKLAEAQTAAVLKR